MTLFTENPPVRSLRMGGQRGGHIRVLGLTEKEHELAAGNMAAVFANAGFFFFLLVLHSMWDLSSWTRDPTHTRCTGSTLS